MKIDKRKIPILVMILIILLGGNAIIAEGNPTEFQIYAGNQLRTLGMLRGYEDGRLRLENTITRTEVAALTVRIKGYEGLDIIGENRDFSDLRTGHWGYLYIQNAYKLNLIQGYPDGTFKPEANITYAEVITIMVNALGQKQPLEGDWPDNYLAKALELGIIREGVIVEPNKIVTRGEMAELVWHTLLVRQ